jgi:hypothetical protein
MHLSDDTLLHGAKLLTKVCAILEAYSYLEAKKFSEARDQRSQSVFFGDTFWPPLEHSKAF